MSWHFLERWLEKTNQHSTLLGKFWITFLIVVRMVVVASIGDRVYNDDQSEFKCNTQQPGCTNVCFNKFSPMSHLRFWSFQIIFVATPSVIYIVYSGHTSKLKKAQNKSRPRPSQIEDEQDDDDDDQEGGGGGGGGGGADKTLGGAPMLTSGSKRTDARNLSLLSGKRRSGTTKKCPSGIRAHMMTSQSNSHKYGGGGGSRCEKRKGTPPNYDEKELILNTGSKYDNDVIRGAAPRSAMIRLINPENFQYGGGGRAPSSGEMTTAAMQRSRSRVTTTPAPIVATTKAQQQQQQNNATTAATAAVARHNNNNNNNTTTTQEQQQQQQQAQQQQQQQQQSYAFVWREPTTTNQQRKTTTTTGNQQYGGGETSAAAATNPAPETGAPGAGARGASVKPFHHGTWQASNDDVTDDENKKDSQQQQKMERASLLKESCVETRHHPQASPQPPPTSFYHHNDRYIDVISSSQQHLVPTAPPEYPGFTNTGFDAQRGGGAGGIPRKISASKPASLKRGAGGRFTSCGVGAEMSADHPDVIAATQAALERKRQRRAQASKVANQTVFPPFAQHFRWYLVSVLMRLCMEVFFVYMQVRLYGFSVEELYKCERRPCPNMVDCFVSRPKEKTIFLWFMFIYSCICIILNFMEVIYLLYSYVVKYSKKKAANGNRRSKSPPIIVEDSKMNSGGGIGNDAQLIKHLSEERERIKGHELVSVAGHGGQVGVAGHGASKLRGMMDCSGKMIGHHNMVAGGGARWGGGGGGKYCGGNDKDVWNPNRKESNYYKYPSALMKFHHITGGEMMTNSHEISDYMTYDDDVDDIQESDDDHSGIDDSELDRIAPDQLDDINIEYNEIDINDIPLDDDVNDALGQNDDCV